MKVWIITESDYDDVRIVAVYPSEAMAVEHTNLMGGLSEEREVLTAIHPDAINPTKQSERTVAKEKAKKYLSDQQAQREADAKSRAEVRPRPPYMSLCHCETFSNDLRFLNTYGHCSYCGGFIHKIFREHMGEVALQSAIDELELYVRKKMRHIISQAVAT